MTRKESSSSSSPSPLSSGLSSGQRTSTTFTVKDRKTRRTKKSALIIPENATDKHVQHLKNVLQDAPLGSERTHPKTYLFAQASNIGEKLLTWYAITHYGAREMNPILGSLLNFYGLLPGIIIGGILSGLGLYTLYNKKYYGIVTYTGIFYFLIMIWNTLIILYFT